MADQNIPDYNQKRDTQDSGRDLHSSSFTASSLVEINKESFPPHCDPRAVAQFYCSYESHIDALLETQPVELVSPIRYKDITDRLFLSSESRMSFCDDERYLRNIFAQTVLHKNDSNNLIVLSLIHYASEDNPSLSLVPLKDKLYAPSLAPIVMRVDTILSGNSGVKAWQYSDTDITPMFSQQAFAHAVQDLDSYQRKTVRRDNLLEVPYLLRIAAEKVMSMLPFKERKELKVQIDSQEESAQFRFKAACNAFRIDCALENNEVILTHVDS